MFRLGIIRQHARWSRWQHDCVQAILAGSFARIALVIEAEAPSPVRLPMGARAGADRSLGALLPDLPSLALSVPPTAEQRQAIAGHTLDLVLDLSGLGHALGWSKVARLGAWSFHLGDPDRDDGLSPGLAPVARGDLASGCALVRLGEDGQAEVLREGWFKTRPTPRRDTDQMLLRAARWPALVLHAMAETRSAPQVVRRLRLPPPQATSEGTMKLQAARRFAGYALDSLRRRFCRERWSIGIVDRPIEAVIREKRLGPVCWIAGQPQDRFYADPFPLRQDGGALEILVESAPYATALGHLARLRIGADGALVDETPILQAPHHLSYPSILRAEEGEFILPESWEADRLSAHTIGNDGMLVRETDLVVGRALVDGTLVRHEGRWFLFACDRRDDDTTNLHVFHAAHWHGPFLPHPMNPVKTDVRSSRPAGALVTVDGQLYRPAQDCALRYGNAVAINRIVELDEQRFREELHCVLRPDAGGPFPDGLHTINGIGDKTIIDGQKLSFEPVAAMADQRARRKARKRRDR
jgi:hypothetical protein